MSSSTPTSVFRSPTAPIAGVARAVLASAVLALGACAPGPSVTPSPTEPSGAPSPASGESPAAAPLRYVALGDSYTIGTSVTVSERWPDQLVVRLPRLELVSNLGVNGFTSRDVIEVELPRLAALRPDVVTLLIGVNDLVQGVPTATYRRNVAELLDELARQVGPGRVLVVTTPDYTVTPSGADYGDPARQAVGIRANNAIVAEESASRGISVVDIHDLSLRAVTDRTLVAVDGLHPSGAQYALWVDRIAPAMEALIEP